MIQALSPIYLDIIPRENAVHWTVLLYLEMFVAGIAAGAYVMAAFFELAGRGRSPVVRTAHLIAFPLMAIAGILLIVDLEHPERFWHMVVQSLRQVPMLKWWSPMSAGSWAVLVFPAFAFVSFVDALIAGGLFSIGGWRRDRTLHGTTLGLIWSFLGGLVAFFVASYSGVLLNVTNFAGWSNSALPLAGALFLATAAVTGVAAVVLIEAIRGATNRADVQALVQAGTPLILWQLLLLILFVFFSGQTASGLPVYLTGLRVPLSMLAAAILGGVLPLVLLRMRGAARPGMAALVAVLVLVGGLMVRYGVVMGPQVGMG